jgi:multidrug efflux system membrane fusion protein
VRHGAQGDFIFQLQPDRTVKLRVVKTGPADGNRIAILSGLSAGATVVTAGADSLDDGSKVSLPGDKHGFGVGAGRRHRWGGESGGNANGGEHRHRRHRPDDGAGQ